MNINKLKLTFGILFSGAVLSVIAITTFGTSKESIHTNTVYTAASSAPSATQVSTSLATNEKTLDTDFYIKQCEDLIQQYFDITISDAEYNTTVRLMDEYAINTIKSNEEAEINLDFERNEYSAEERDMRLKDVQMHYDYLQTKLQTLGTNYIACDIYSKSIDNYDNYSINFDAKTNKPLLLFHNSAANPADVMPTMTDDELTTIGSDYIKRFHLADIQTPKIDYINTGNNCFALFKDANDPSKKVALLINAATGKVFGIYLEGYVDFMMQD